MRQIYSSFPKSTNENSTNYYSTNLKYSHVSLKYSQDSTIFTTSPCQTINYKDISIYSYYYSFLIIKEAPERTLLATLRTKQERTALNRKWKYFTVLAIFYHLQAEERS